MKKIEQKTINRQCADERANWKLEIIEKILLGCEKQKNFLHFTFALSARSASIKKLSSTHRSSILSNFMALKNLLYFLIQKFNVQLVLSLITSI
jgi:hypothetical protein